MDNALFSIGDIVALRSHPYTKNQQRIIISGDSLLISPLMVVGEIQLVNINVFRREEKEEVIRYKCHWFSSKSFDFCEYSFTEDQLKLISKNDDNLDELLSGLKRGDCMVFKTGVFELQKRKSSFSIKADKKKIGEDNVLITPMLTYLPPILQVVDIVKNESKTPLINKKTKRQQREVSDYLAKCIFFEIQSDKAREVSLPIEALNLLIQTKEELIDMISVGISDDSHFLLLEEERSTFIKPNSIYNKYGKYYVKAFDYLLNSIRDIELIDSISLEKVDKIFREEHPAINFESQRELPTSDKVLTELSDAIEKGVKSKLFIRINYRNKYDELTVRTIRDYKQIKFTENSSKISYLVGHCLLRDAERHFRVSRIESLQILDLSFERKKEK